MRTLCILALAASVTGCNSWSTNKNLDNAYRAYERGDCEQVMLDLSRAERKSRARPWLGAKFQNADVGASLQVVFSDGPAQQAGLSAGDVVIAVNGLRVNGGNLEKMLGSYAPGDALELCAFRRDELMRATVILGEVPVDTSVLTLPADPDRRHRAERWILGAG